jgi:hypothetical protein
MGCCVVFFFLLCEVSNMRHSHKAVCRIIALLLFVPSSLSESWILWHFIFFPTFFFLIFFCYMGLIGSQVKWWWPIQKPRHAHLRGFPFGMKWYWLTLLLLIYIYIYIYKVVCGIHLWSALFVRLFGPHIAVYKILIFLFKILIFYIYF